MRALPYIIISFLVYAVLFYLHAYQPETLAELIVRVDIFGFTNIANAEQQRLAKIKELTIPYDQKQVLVDRTVFIGASSDMVKLALGNPIKITRQPWPAKKVVLTYYVYYLPNDKRPTILVFQEGKLIYAYKASVLDVGH